MSVISYPHIFVTSDGTATIGKTRYKVVHLAAEHYYYGWSAEELLRQHPDLRPEEVYAALAFFYDNYAELVAAMQSASGIEANSKKNHKNKTLSRSELLERRPVSV